MILHFKKVFILIEKAGNRKNFILECEESLLKEMNKRIKGIEKSKTSREDRKEDKRLENEEKRLKSLALKRQANIAMAIELEDDINKKQKKENLMTKIDCALNFANKATAELLDMKKVYIAFE